MKNRLFLIACGLVIGGICAGSAHAAIAEGTKKTYSYKSVERIMERYDYHFAGSGWNTPYHNLGVCYRNQEDPDLSTSPNYGQENFGTYYRYSATTSMGSKSLTCKVIGDGTTVSGDKVIDVVASNKNSTTMTNPNDTFTINKKNLDHTLTWYYAAIDTDYCILKAKKPTTATWSLDFTIFVYPFESVKRN